MVRRTRFEARVNARGDDAPDVKAILKSMNWEERLAEARERRARVLAAKGAPADPAPSAALPPEPEPVAPPDETNLHRLTLVPLAAEDRLERATGLTAPEVPVSEPLADAAAAVPAPIRRRRSTLSTMFAAGFGLGIGVALGFGLLALFVPAERIVPTVTPPAPPVAAGEETATRSVQEPAPQVAPAPAPSQPTAAPALPASAAPVALAAVGPASLSGPDTGNLSLAAPAPDLGLATTGTPLTVSPLAPSDRLPAVEPGLGQPSDGPAQPLLVATLSSPEGAGFILPQSDAVPTPTAKAALPLPSGGGEAPGSPPGLSTDGRVRAAAPVPGVALPVSELDLLIPDRSARPEPAARIASLDPPVIASALPVRPAGPEPVSVFAAAAPPDFADLSIFVFVPPSRSGNATDAIVGALRETGLPVGAPRTAGFTIRQNHVRYYHPRDAETAGILAEAVDGPARDFTGFRPSPPEGTIEIWLSGQAPSRSTGAGGEGSPLLILRDRLVQSLRRGDILGQ